MKLILIGFLFFWINTLVVGQSNKLAKNENDSHAISINFEPTKGIDKSFKFSNGVVVNIDKPEVTIFDENKKIYLALGKISINQKKHFAVNGNQIITRHDINSLDYFDYIFEKNDSIVFNYMKSIPFVIIRNKSYLKYDYNFESYFKNRSVKETYSPITIFFNPNFFHNFSKNFAEDSRIKLTPEKRMNKLLITNSGIKNNSYPRAMLLLRSENNLLDSLKEQKLISEKPYHFYKNKVENLSYILDIETNRLSAEQIKGILEKHTVNPYGYPEIYHEQLLEAVADKYITEKAPILDIKDGVNRDYRQVYTRLSTSSLFSEKDKNYLLTREINRIGKTFSRVDFLSFFKKYEKDVKDTALVSSVRSNYALEFDSDRNATSSIILADLKNNKLTFDDLLKRHKGKTIYVDFWASWCGPCREALPQSAKLRNELKGKNVVFVYLSIDRTIKPWQTASAQEKLDAYTESYLVVNYKTSDFMKQQKVTSIPRYMIFDRKGKLAYANAPKVESKDLPSVLTGMVK